MGNPLFPTRETVAEIRQDLAATATERGAAAFPSAMRMSHRPSQYEVEVDLGTGYQTDEFRDFLSSCMDGRLDHYLVPTKEKPPGYDGEDIQILRSNVVIPMTDQRPSGAVDVGGYNNTYCMNPWSVHEIADHFAPYGTVFVIDAQVAQHEFYFGGQSALDMYTLNGVGSNSDRWFSLPVLLTQSAYVILNGQIVANPFCDSSCRREMPGVKDYELTKRCRPFLRFFEDKLKRMFKEQFRQIKCLRLILANVPRIRAARLKSPESAFLLKIEGHEFEVPHDLPLPPANMGEFVTEAMALMADEPREIAGKIWANLQPRPMKDVLRIYDELESSSLEVLLQQNPDPKECLRRLSSYSDEYTPYVQYITPEVFKNLGEQISISDPKRDVWLQFIEKTKLRHEKRMLERYQRILQFFERAFTAWITQEHECRELIPTSFSVEGNILKIREELVEVRANHVLEKFSAEPFKRRIIRFADPAYYLEILDRIAQWKSPKALAMLEAHRQNISLLDPEILAKVDEAIEKCRG